MSDVALRYWQILLDQTEYYTDTLKDMREAGEMVPTGIYLRALVSPDEATYICSAEKMAGLLSLDIGSKWPEETDEDYRDQWERDHLELGERFDYYRWRDIVQSYGKDAEVTFREPFVHAFAFQGEYPDTNEGRDQAVEDAYAQVLV